VTRPDGHRQAANTHAAMNYSGVLLTIVWTLTCPNGIVDHVGLPGRRKQCGLTG
jgi:hypothetical protein